MPTSKKKVVARRRRPRQSEKPTTAFNGVLALSNAAFGHFEECMNNPGAPTVSVRRGAAMLRELYNKTR